MSRRNSEPVQAPAEQEEAPAAPASPASVSLRYIGTSNEFILLVDESLQYRFVRSGSPVEVTPETAEYLLRLFEGQFTQE